MDLGKLEKGTKDGIGHLRGLLDFDIILPLLGIEPTGWHGDWVQSSCPNFYGLHEGDDASPSFGINTDSLGYNCFVCGGGSLEKLVAGIFEIDEEAAIKWLEDHSTQNYLANSEDFRNEIEKMLAGAQKTKEVLPEYPPDFLFQYDKVHPYVWQRGLSREVVVEMQIGFGEEHMAIVIPHWFKRKLRGIIYRHLAQDSKGRYLCPHASCNPPAKTKTPKYKNTSRFPSNTTLYNYDIASEFDWVIVVESPFTALYLMSHGYRNVVATFGAGLSGEQSYLLSRFAKVLLWPDNDPAGSQWFVQWGEKKGKRYIKGPSDALITLERQVMVFIVPAVPGNKADPADVAPSDIPRYLEAKYLSTFFPMEGLKIGYEKDNQG